MSKTSNKDFPEPNTSWTHYVSYGETDGMGVAYYAHYLHWFEQARSDFLRKLGFSYAQIEKQGIFLPVREACCRYISTASFDEQIAVKTGIGKWSRATLSFFYEIYNLCKENKLITSGYTQHACINRSGKPVAVPEWLKNITIQLPS